MASSTTGEGLRVLAVMRSEQSSDALKGACAAANGPRIEVEVGDLKSILSANGFAARRDVLLLDVDPREPDQIELLGRFLAEHKEGISVVVTAPEPTGEQVRSFMRLGAVDVLPQPIQAPDLADALNHVAQRITTPAARRAPAGKVIAFIKGGGGVGATTLAVQTGYHLAKGAEAEPTRTCLLDLDFQFGTAALSLDLATKSSLADLLEQPERLDRTIIKHVMAQHASGLEILAPPRNLLPLDAVTPEFIVNCLALAREEYRYVLLDLPANWTDWSYACLEEADLIVLVTELTVTAVQRAIRQLETLRLNDLGKKPLKLVLNKRDTATKIFGLTFGTTANLDQAEKALGRKFDHTIARDSEAVGEAINQGVPIADIDRKTLVNEDIAKLIDGIRQKLRELDPNAEALLPEPRRKKDGMLIDHVLTRFRH